jgi:hypothetical protein
VRAMKVFRKNDHILVLDNVKRIEGTEGRGVYDICLYYNDGTFEKITFLGNYIQMEATLSNIVKAMKGE